MKIYIMLIMLFAFGIIKDAKLDPYSKTGHDQFLEIKFVEDGDQEEILLINMTKKSIDNNLKRIKSKFMGTNTIYKYKYKDVEFVSSVVFSRSNKTSETFVFDYSLQTVYYKESSFNVKGSLNYKNVTKKKEVENQFTANVAVEYETTESTKKTETAQMKVTVHPNKKITLRVAGDGKISMGYSKTFVFWICFKKGAWETVDVVTTYFELVQEDV